MNLNKVQGILIDVCKEQAKKLSLKTPSEDLIIQKIDDLLFERGSYEATKIGLVTKEETASLILQHFQTLICKCSDVGEDEIDTYYYEDLVSKIVEELFDNGNDSI